MTTFTKIVTRLTTQLIVCVVCCTLAIPAQAATREDVFQALTDLQSQLASFQKNQMIGTVLGASAITVTNDSELVNAVWNAKGGETIKLAPGNYSALVIYRQIPPELAKSVVQAGATVKSGSPTLTAPVTITSADLNNRAVMKGLVVKNTEKWQFQNLSFRPTATGTNAAIRLTNVSDTKFTNNDISWGDSSSWSKADWLSKTGYAISATQNDGTKPRTEIAYNYIKNVGYGVDFSGFVHFHHNVIDSFHADAMRGWSNVIYEHNIIKNPIAASSNHRDGFQSFTRDADGRVGKGINTNTVIRHNSFIASTKNHPLRGTMQGIGMFDGFFDNWTIENNLLLINQYNGITIQGAHDTVIQNNVVLDPDPTLPGPAAIAIRNHKNGTAGYGNKILNNYANNKIAASSTNFVASGNVQVTPYTYTQYFQDQANYNYTIKAGAFPFAVGASIDVSKLAPEPFPNEAGSGVVLPPPVPEAVVAPTITLTAAPASVKVGEPVTVTWSTQQATTCTGSGAWSGSKAVQGSQSITLSTAGTKTVTLSCTGAGGTKTTAANYTVVAAVATSTASGKTVAIVGLTAQQAVTGMLKVEAKPAGFTKVTRVTFAIDGQVVTTESYAPYALGGDTNKVINGYDTTKLTDGAHTLKITTTGDGATVVNEIPFTVRNGAVVPPVVSSGVTMYTTDTLNVRSTANGTKIGTQPKGVQGGMMTDTAVTAGGIRWVKVDFVSGVDGYVAQNFLATTVAGSSSVNEMQAQIDALLRKIAELQVLMGELNAAE